MADKTLPPLKRPGDNSAAARGIKDGPAIDQNSVTLQGFAPVATATESTATPEAPSSDQTLNNYAPLAPSPAAIPQDETHPRAGDPTIVAPPPDDRTLSPHFMPTVDMRDVASVGSDQTLAGGPDATMGGGLDAATREFHKAAMASAPKAITKGATFGHYELIEPIAKGGMGIVYKARQRNLNRIVAIKMILAGQFADQSDIDRFYAEAEAAAALSHPNIVAIHEIGEVSGQHFFSMDFIEGQSLAGLIQENPVPPRRAAEFTRTIAETMQFAHESGVVHRDLKPANVLLDKRQRPLITDFGLAKQVSNTSQLTMAGSIVGTPSYMPPEQAAGKIDEVGPWSDLYSIGAILYELLTGRPPFRAATPFETIRQVLEQEPPSPRLLNPALPRDLETICLKCLQKERTRRYGSAQELADELGRFLRGEPIHARPISQVARLWRLCKRYPLTSSAIAMAVVILITATIVSTGFYIQAARALVKETEAKALAEQRKAEADRKRRDAMAAVNDLFTTVSENSLLNQPGTQPVRKELLLKAQSYYERFSKETPDDPEIQIELADANYRMGRIAVLLSALDDSIGPFNKARQMQQSLLEVNPDDPVRLKALSDTLTQLGQVWILKKDFEAASRDYADAIRIRGELARVAPDNDENQRLWANGHMNAGLIAVNIAQAMPEKNDKYKQQIEEARVHYLEAQKIREAWLARDEKHYNMRRDLAKGFTNLGNLADFDQQYDQATDNLKKAVALYEGLLSDDPANLEIQRDLATARRRVADLYYSAGKAEDARQWYQQALRRLDTLVRENPDVPEYQAQKASLLLNLKVLEKQEGNTAVAIASLERARRIYDTLVEKHKEVASYRNDLLVTLKELASEQEQSGEQEAARTTLDETLVLLTQWVQEFPDELTYVVQRGDAYMQLARVIQEPAAALEACKSATTVFEKLVGEDPKDADSIIRLAEAHQLAGDKLKTLGQPIEARHSYRQGVEVFDAALKNVPDEPAFLDRQAMLLLQQYYVESDDMRWQAAPEDIGTARRSLGEALNIIARLAKGEPENYVFQYRRAELLTLYGGLETEEGNFTAARSCLEQAGQIWDKLAADKPDADDRQLRRFDVFLRLFELENTAGNASAARSAWEQARDILDALTKDKPAEPAWERALLLMNYFDLEKKTGITSAARPALAQAQNILDDLLKNTPDQEWYLLLQARLWFNMFELELHDGNQLAARAVLQQARNLATPLAEKYKASARNLIYILREAATQQIAAGDRQTAATSLDEAIRRLQALVERFPGSVEFAALLKEMQALSLSLTQN